ncbi:hypothetical protein JK200_02615 [Gluconobacter cerinus]|nr:MULTISPECIES: hypothetical protein [Gluconobacter]MBS1025175.1 hypothetical protein [Gluconobacter cerinus]MBS1037696.1 hypothetical protein [Gluconobacter cerinus]MBS1042861.1 hypothetical protein [Gluconobacter cerinus]OUJ08113.1 hypothetical protein HK24_03885 [Gluconobacter sp. DsW_058]
MSRFPLRMACSTVFSIRGLLMMSTAFGLLAVHSQAHADDDVMSRMEKEMHRLQEAQAHVQQEQEEINRDLVMLRSEMSQASSHGSASRQDNDEHDNGRSRHAFEVRHSWSCTSRATIPFVPAPNRTYFRSNIRIQCQLA